MIKHYIKISLRNLKKYRTYTFLNICGLSVGLTSIYFILLFVNSEMGYDRHHTNYEALYRVNTELNINGERTELATTPPGLAKRLLKDFPEVQEVTRILPFLGIKKNTLILNNERISEESGFLADPNLFDVLKYQVVYGDLSTALNEPHSIVLSETLYKTIFKSGNPVNKTIKISNRNGEYSYTVKGVFKDDYYKSHLQPKFIVSMNSGVVGKFAWNNDRIVGGNFMYTYVRLRESTEGVLLSEKIPNFLSAYMNEIKHGHNFQPIADIYLHPVSRAEFGLTGNIKYIYILFGVGILILIIACINYTNMATAQATKRAEEIGVRKAFGANKRSIIWQFLSESLIITSLAMIISVVMLFLLRSSFIELTGNVISYIDFFNTLPLFILLGIVLSIISGGYPALYLSGLKIGSTGYEKLGNKNMGKVRKVLVVMQIAISATMLFGTLTIFAQMGFINGKALGFEKHGRLVIPLQDYQIKKQYEALKDDFSRISGVESVTGTSYSPVENVLSNNPYFLNKTEMESEQGISISQNDIDYGLIEILNFDLLAGRTFDSEISSNDKNSVILNETAVNALGVSIDNIINKHIYTKEDSIIDMTVIGVIKDFHSQSLHKPIEPYLFSMRPGRTMSSIILNFDQEVKSGLLFELNKTWSKLFPDHPFEYQFLSEQWSMQYNTDKRFGDFINFFTIIALVLSCIGLFALTSFTIQQMTKEIGIRKVLGASTLRIYYRVTSRFLVLIIFGFIVSLPIAFFTMEKWLSSYSYHIDFGWQIIVKSFLICMIITLLVISFKILSASKINPSITLRNNH